MTQPTAHIPPAGRNPRENKGQPKDDAENAKVTGHDERQRNLKEEGRQGNITQNTTNQGSAKNRGRQ
ncbi:MAG: hypothetical protein ACYCZX_19365 [Rhodospirillaceae bacterium]